MNRISMTRACSLLGASVVSLLAALPASAQGRTDAGDSVALEEIVVTARKREESLLDVPLSVTAVSAAILEERSIRDIRDLAAFTPGLSYTASFGRTALERPVIRGQSNIIGRPNASFFVDGVYLSGSAASTEIDNLERIEVIKGPQAAQFGRSTFAGAINYVTRKPSDTFEGKATLSYGEDDLLEGMLSASGPVTDTLSYYIGVRHYETGGQYTNSLDGSPLGEEESNGGTVKLRWTPIDSFEANLLLTIAEDRDGGLALGFQGREWNDCQARSATLPRSRGYRCGEVIDTDLLSFRQRNNILPRGGGLERDRARGALRLNWDFLGEYELVSVSAYTAEQYKNATDQSWNGYDAFAPNDPAVQPPIPAGPTGLVVRQFLNSGSFWRDNWEDRNDFSQELRVNSPTGKDRRFIWSAGLYYFTGHDDQTASLKAFPDGTILANGTAALSLEETTNKAVFGSAEYRFTDRWTLTAEVRQAEDEISVVNLAYPLVSLSTTGGVWSQVVAGMAGVPLPTSVAYAIGASPMGTFKSTTPRASLRFEPNDESTYYLTWARGNKPGGFNSGNVVLLLNQQGISDTFDEEEVESTEIGGKFRLLDGRMQLNVAAFYNDLLNQQLTANIAGQVGTQSIVGSYTSNAGESEIYGLELELQARLTENWDVSAGYAYVDPTFTSYLNSDQADLYSPRVAGTFSPPPAGTCVTVNPPAGVLTCQQVRDLDNAQYGDVAGKDLPRAPRHQGYISSTWRRPLANDMTLSIGGDVTYEASKFDQIHNLLETGDRTYVNARIGIDGEKWSLQLWGKNLADDNAPIDILRYIDARTPLPANVPGASPWSVTGSPRGFVITPPRQRQFGLTATYRF